jgi:hypothetical protein
MPRARRARDKRTRARKAGRRDPKKLTLLLPKIEVPLNDAIRYVRALNLAAKGVILEYDEDGEGIYAVTSLASERLEEVKDTWRKAHQEWRRQKTS